jgi:hypothetical protein
MKTLFLILAATLALFAQSTIVTFPDVTMVTSTAVAASSTPVLVQHCQLFAPAANTAVIAFGDSNVSLTRGAQIAPGGAQYLPWPTFNLATLKLMGTTGDKLKISCLSGN